MPKVVRLRPLTALASRQEDARASSVVRYACVRGSRRSISAW
jgi:hypothetical protein